MTIPTNIFDDLPQHLPKEVVQTLIRAADVRIERIISHGHASPRVVKILSRARKQVANELFICSLAKISAERPRSVRRTGGEQ